MRYFMLNLCVILAQEVNKRSFGYKLIEFFYQTPLGQQYLKDVKQTTAPDGSLIVKVRVSSPGMEIIS